MMSSKNNGFKASDIERYHSGKMSPEERHALEKAALDDPFLADALEGYAFTTTPHDDLAKVRSRLDEKLDRKKVVPFFQKYRWLSVAAILLIIAGTAWLAYNIAGKESTTPTAVQKTKVSDTIPVATSPQNVLRDSAITNAAPVSQGSFTNNQTKIPSNKNKKEQVTVELTAHKQLGKAGKREASQNDNAQIVSKAISTPDQNEIASSNKWAKNNQRGYRTMNNVSSEPRLNNASNNVADKSLFLKKAENNNTDLAGKISGIKTNDTIKDLNIVLKPLPGKDSLDEIVVGYGTQKKSTEKYPHVTIDTLEPAEGYVSFDDYVVNNLKMPDEIKTKTISGEVQLSFDVDTEGQPTNITVVKSLCQKCDEEAVRLLKEGPKWKKGKNKKGKITIKF